MMNPWLIVGFVLAVSGAFSAGYWRGDSAGQATVQQQWDQERVKQATEYAAAQAAAREKEQELQRSADLLRKEKDREIRDLSARASALTNSLRDRQARAATQSSDVPGAASAGSAASSCTGAGLSREDAQFLAGEAARADELRVALKQCIAQYQAVKGK